MIPKYIRWIALTGFIFLVLMSLLRLALMLSFKTPVHQTVPYFDIYLLGFRYDLRDVCIISLVVFIAGSIPFLHPFGKKLGKQISFILWVIFCIGIVIFYTADFANYAYLSQRLNISILNYLDDAKISIKMIWETYHVIWVLIILIVCISLLIALVRASYNYILSVRSVTTKASRIVWSIVFTLLLAWGTFGSGNQYPLRWSNAFGLGNDYAANLSLNPFQSLFSSITFHNDTYNLNKVKQSYSWMSSFLQINHPDNNNLSYDRNIAATDSNTSKPNVVIVICESFSAYKSSAFGNPLQTTPFFDSLTQKGIFFNRCFTPCYGTARGVWAVLTGIPDVTPFASSSRNPSAVNQHTIMNDFIGYEKFYFIGGSASWANIRGLLTNNISGLHLYEQENYDAKKVDVWGISDKNLFLNANNVLSQQNKPFIAIIQTADNHRPYTIPKEDLQEFHKKIIKKDSLRKYGYDNIDEFNAFRYTDFCYRKFIEAAKQSSYFKNTIFVFVGDHGIPGDASALFPQAWTEELTYEHVPLLFYAPGLLQPQRLNYYVSQIDILPTVASLCNISYRNSTLGRNILDEKFKSDPAQHAAFIYDNESKRIGVVQDGYYYSYGLNNTSPEKIWGVSNNNPAVISPAFKIKLRNSTDAFYETSRYMILNNKKK